MGHEDHSQHGHENVYMFWLTAVDVIISYSFLHEHNDVLSMREPGAWLSSAKELPHPNSVSPCATLSTSHTKTDSST